MISDPSIGPWIVNGSLPFSPIFVIVPPSDSIASRSGNIGRLLSESSPSNVIGDELSAAAVAKSLVPVPELPINRSLSGVKSLPTPSIVSSSSLSLISDPKAFAAFNADSPSPFVRGLTILDLPFARVAISRARIV